MYTNSKPQSADPNAVRIEPRGKSDIALLNKTVDVPEMTKYLGRALR